MIGCDQPQASWSSASCGDSAVTRRWTSHRSRTSIGRSRRSTRRSLGRAARDTPRIRRRWCRPVRDTLLAHGTRHSRLRRAAAEQLRRAVATPPFAGWRRCSRVSACWRLCLRRSVSTASSPIESPFGRRRSACGWRSGRGRTRRVPRGVEPRPRDRARRRRDRRGPDRGADRRRRRSARRHRADRSSRCTWPSALIWIAVAPRRLLSAGGASRARGSAGGAAARVIMCLKRAG